MSSCDNIKNSENYPRFHLAIPVSDLQASKKFYVDNFNCKIGRTAEKWIDFDFFGHQLSIHEKPEEVKAAATNIVDGDNVPVRHFGLIADWNDWHNLSDKLNKNNVEFIIEPHIRFKGEVGEQATMFLLDPDGNAIEIKSFYKKERLFAS